MRPSRLMAYAVVCLFYMATLSLGSEVRLVTQEDMATGDPSTTITSTGGHVGHRISKQIVLPAMADVTDYGATNDNVETTANLQAALDNAYALGKTTVMPAGNYKISSKLVIKGNVWGPDATIWVTGSPAIAVEVSTGSSANPTDYLINQNFIYLPNIVNVDKPATGWAAQGIGVRIVNLYSCDVHLNLIKNFDTNLLITSYGPTMNAYNNYYIGNLSNGKINLKIAPGDGTSATNENNFYGGRYSHYSAEGDNVTGVRHIYIDNTYSIPNNNAFWKPSLEGDVPEWHVEDRGTYNTYFSARWEATIPRVYFNGVGDTQGSNNSIIYGYDTPQVTESAGRFYNSTISRGGYKTGGVVGVQNGTATNPGIVLYSPTAGLLSLLNPLTDYGIGIGARYADFKQSTDLPASPRLRIDANYGFIYFGGGYALGPYFSRVPAADPGIMVNGGFLAHAKISHTDNNATPDVSGGNYHLINNAGATTISGVTGAYVGQELIFECQDNTTVFSGATIKTSAAFTCTPNDTIRFLYNGTNLLELSRSVN